VQDLDHKHLIITAAVKRPPETAEEVEKWLLKVVDAVDMKVLMPPRAIRCDTPGNEGVTGLVCIETSHASIHVWSECDVPFLKFDIYSCKRFDPEMVNECISEFEPYWYESSLIDRNSSLSIIDKQQRQVASIIDMLDSDTKQHYLESNRVIRRETGRTTDQKAARATYARLANKFSIKVIQRARAHLQEHKTTLNVIRSRAVAKGLDYDLTPEWYDSALIEAQKQWPKVVAHGSDDSFWRADVDRKDSTQGYTQDNCRIIPHALSVAKWKWNARELEELSILLVQEVSRTPAQRLRSFISKVFG
jgi:S-adenosylmethionine/arginine decarboxylase-like enzyme